MTYFMMHVVIKNFIVDKMQDMLIFPGAI